MSSQRDAGATLRPERAETARPARAIRTSTQVVRPEYVELKFEVAEQWLDLLALALLECGCLGFEVREGTLADRSLVIAYFPAGAPSGSVVERLVPWLRTYEAKDVSWLRVAGQDWNALWRSTYRPIEVGKLLTVLPSWSRCRVRDRLVVRIKPDFAFGTGSHETTRLCLEALTQVSPRGRQVADVGTGSGILAIAAVRLGASQVYACDPDPLALVNAKHNLKLNRVADRVTLAPTELNSLPADGFDLVLANLVLEPLRDGVTSLRRACRTGADLIVSGLLASQEDAWLPLAEQEGFSLVTRRVENDWLLLHLRLAPDRGKI